MSILTKEDRKDLVYSMRKFLLEQVKDHVLTESQKVNAKNFIINEATYEQLLNLSFNPERETDYKSIEVLEKVAVQCYFELLQEATYEELMHQIQKAARMAQMESTVQEAEMHPLTNEPMKSIATRQKWIRTIKAVPRSKRIADVASKYGQKIISSVKK